MDGTHRGGGHAAEAAALGFYYQAFYALLTLLGQNTDQAAVGVEQLDDVELKADGRALLFQLKHSMTATPVPITMKCRPLWRTIKVWIDLLPIVSLSETSFHLVAVGGIDPASPLVALVSPEADRADLHDAMVEEALRVVNERAAAETKKQAPLPYADRIRRLHSFPRSAGYHAT